MLCCFLHKDFKVSFSSKAVPNGQRRFLNAEVHVSWQHSMVDCLQAGAQTVPPLIFHFHKSQVASVLF